jgi:hypothetical protein
VSYALPRHSHRHRHRLHHFLDSNSGGPGPGPATRLLPAIQGPLSLTHEAALYLCSLLVQLVYLTLLGPEGI